MASKSKIIAELLNDSGLITADKLAADAIAGLSWDTTVKTSSFTAEKNFGYYVDTTSASITVTLPASPSVGDVIGFVDYAGTTGTNRIVIAPNGSNFQGAAFDLDLNSTRSVVHIAYADATQGWVPITAGNETSTKILV